MSQDFAQLAADIIANLPAGATPADARRALQTLAPIDQVAALVTTTNGTSGGGGGGGNTIATLHHPSEETTLGELRATIPTDATAGEVLGWYATNPPDRLDFTLETDTLISINLRATHQNPTGTHHTALLLDSAAIASGTADRADLSPYVYRSGSITLLPASNPELGYADHGMGEAIYVLLPAGDHTIEHLVAPDTGEYTYSDRTLTVETHGPATDGGAGGPTSLTDLTDVNGTPGLGKSPVDDGTGTYNLTPVTTQTDLNDVLDRVANVVWNDIGTPGQPPFQSSFRNIGDPWSPCRYRTLANSTVRLQGTVTCDDPTIADATWIPIFQLPPEVAPGHNLEFSALTNDNAISRMYIWTDGTVVWGGYAIGPHAPIARLPLNFLSWSTQGPAT
jgi:hypothetical protein